MPASDLVARLVRDGILVREGDEHRTTRRWQGAMARAAAFLGRHPDAPEDLRVPIALAVTELYPNCVDDFVVALVDVLLPLESRELAPAFATA